ncbi:MAG TPA: polysaccharide biosynthesis/export family protein [Pirellulales bacterium]|nr:polysaccharide biosynthesis/export family protein [Pirellulales bacterium]
MRSIASIKQSSLRRDCLWFIIMGLCAVGGGCSSPRLGSKTWAPPSGCGDPKLPTPPAQMPRELAKVSLPDYIIEPPDILLIDAVKVVPKPPYKIESLDVLSIYVSGTLPDNPIQGEFTVEPGGMFIMGPPYGSIKLAGMDLEQAKEAIRKHLLNYLREPEVSLVLTQRAAAQQIAGEHLVGMDGKVTLGTFGKVYVAGMSQDMAKRAIENHLSQTLENPIVAIDIFAYNSKVYYVILQNCGAGDGVTSVPIKGNETVLDAMAEVGGLENASSKRIWIARPAPSGSSCDQVLPVDWHAVTQRADTTTNYQIMPGDRLFVAEDGLMKVNDGVAKFTAPLQRLFGATLMGTFTAKTIDFFGSNTGGGI